MLQILTEDRMAAGFDADGQDTTGRALQILWGWERISETLDAPGAPWDKAAREPRSRLRGVLRQAMPLLSRLARPSRGRP